MPTLAVEPIRFQQLFQNLIGNALKYRKMDHPPQIRVTAERRECGWLFGVRDNGVGIDPKYHQTVFGMFKRLDNGERAGSGLGLAICQKIVERYGGRIWVESRPGEGATFLFSVPSDLERHSAG